MAAAVRWPGQEILTWVQLRSALGEKVPRYKRSDEPVKKVPRHLLERDPMQLQTLPRVDGLRKGATPTSPKGRPTPLFLLGKSFVVLLTGLTRLPLANPVLYRPPNHRYHYPDDDGSCPKLCGSHPTISNRIGINISYEHKQPLLTIDLN